MISVIFLTYNQIKITKKFLESLKENYKHQKFHIIHVDNNSTDGTVEYVKEWNWNPIIEYSLLQNNQNLFFTKGINQGLQAFMDSDNKYCLVCNNDILLSSCAIKNICEDMERFNNKIQCYIPIIYNDFTAFKENENLHNSINRNYNLIDTRFLGCSFVLSKSLIKNVGYLDEEFEFYYSDNDYSERISQRKIPIYLSLGAAVFHFGGQTIQIVPEFYERTEKERKYFYKKWGKYPIGSGE